MSGSGATYYNEELKYLYRLLKNSPNVIPEGNAHDFTNYVPDPQKTKDFGCTKSVGADPIHGLAGWSEGSAGGVGKGKKRANTVWDEEAEKNSPKVLASAAGSHIELAHWERLSDCILTPTDTILTSWNATLHAAAVSSAPCCLRRTVPIHPFYLTTDGISQRCLALAAAYNVSPIWVHGALSCRSGVSKVANTIVSISDKTGKKYEPP
ncbi:hypothetical protein DFH08DRAFT_818273 [Mycena albidolilacea]|uniref:Uncharacterized protein n=1 Tax=Mycena albidolilacea TaxID=1033008 RepID=A0AAD6ZGI4_9AGAR|nr:hypothetical protein DFH08DRAFT_818273 [Mycena albidolilacea]